MAFPLSVTGQTLISSEPPQPGRRAQVAQAMLDVLCEERVGGIEFDGDEIRFHDRSFKASWHPLACFGPGHLEVTESEAGYAIRYRLSCRQLVIGASLMMLIFPALIAAAEGVRTALTLGPIVYVAGWLFLVGGNRAIGKARFVGWLRAGVLKRLITDRDARRAQAAMASRQEFSL